MLPCFPAKSFAVPRRLRPGDLIGVISPAGPVSPSDLKPGLDLLAARGYRIREAPHLYDQNGYLAGDDASRLSDLHNMFRDESVAAIMCSRGGYGSLRLLDRIDYDLIRKRPKIMVGYSDITALLLAVYQQTGLVVFHGPMVRGLSTSTPANMDGLLRILSSQQPLLLEPVEGTPLIPGEARGILLGGNLSLICHMAGTRFLPSLEGAILFIEDRGEALYRIDRMLTHLSLSGQLKGLSGLIAGEFMDCGDPSDIDRLLMEAASGLNIPLIARFPIGHGRNNLTLPIGMPVHLDTRRMTFSTIGTCVR